MPFNIACPQCNAPMSVDESYAGMAVPCKNCGQLVQLPGPGMARPSSGSNTLVVVLIAAVVGLLLCGGVLVALLLPAIQAARAAARNMQSLNNEKQIMMAMHMYHEVNRTMPPAYLADEDGKPLVSWRVLLLPYLEQANLYDQYDRTKPWDDPANAAVTNTMPAAYRSPFDSPGKNHTSYMVFTGPGTAFDGAKAVGLNEMRDGISNTICLVEVNNSGVPWTQPTDLDAQKIDFRIHKAWDPLESTCRHASLSIL